MKKTKALFSVFLSTSLLFGCSQNAGNESQSKDKDSEQEAAATASRLDGVANDYREYALGEIEEFVQATEAFTTAVKTGDIDQAKELYAPSRMHYERAEPIAEAFGDLDPKIDAREGDVPEAEWGGYHRIEKQLWEAGNTDGMAPVADQLLVDVKDLQARIPGIELEPAKIANGA